MGHESQIEPWSPLERRSALLVSELIGFVAKQAMKTAARENPNRWATSVQQPSTWCGRSNTDPAHSNGLRSKKNSSRRDVFSLDFPFYRTLLMPTEPIRAPIGVNVPGLPMAGFQLTLHGRIWVTAEETKKHRNGFWRFGSSSYEGR